MYVCLHRVGLLSSVCKYHRSSVCLPVVDVIILYSHTHPQVFIRWILSVKKNYRNVTYHNWRHAFSVAQTMFVMMKVSAMLNFIPTPTCITRLLSCWYISYEVA